VLERGPATNPSPVLQEEGQNLLGQLIIKYMPFAVRAPSLLKIWIVPAASSLSSLLMFPPELHHYVRLLPLTFAAP